MRLSVVKPARAADSDRAMAYILSAGSKAVADSSLQRWADRVGFKAEAESCTYFTERERPIWLVGAGTDAEWRPSNARNVGGQLAMAARRLGVTKLDVRLDSAGAPKSQPATVRALVTGLVCGGYQVQGPAPVPAPALEEVRLVVPANQADLLSDAAARGAEVGRVINRVRDIANRPGNEAPPMEIAAWAANMARQMGLRCEVWDRNRLERERCHAFLAVAAGSRQPPCLIQLTYRGRSKALRPVIFVGKTITFDTGGISLKPGKNMEWMKFDKSGGMAVLAFMALVASVLKPDRTVIGMLAAAENMPGGAATRPGDVVRARNGKTIEIVNTDAEGRLVLADTLDVACSLKPAAIIDLATLTGAANVALGRPYSAVLSNHRPLSESLCQAGEESGDRLWPLPLDRDYRSLLKTPFADLKNVGDGSAGTIVGGIFLEHFVNPSIPWAHIDLTSAWEERATPHGPAGATLFGAALLAQWVDRGGMESLDT